jgi:hypothetical protein
MGTSNSLVTSSLHGHIEVCRFPRFLGLDNPIVIPTLTDDVMNAQGTETSRELKFLLGEKRIVWKFC